MEARGVAVVGGGVSGLAVMRELHSLGDEVELFEARDRLGGRIESMMCGEQRVDLGPTWFWPAQRRVRALIERASVRTIPQHDPGDVLVLESANDPVRRLRTEALHGGARRVAQGMQCLVEALSSELPVDRIHLEHALRSVRRKPDHLELEFDVRGESKTVRVSQVVLAMPPRIVAEQVEFEPELGNEVEAALHATQTWMGTAAKVVLCYPNPFWREAGHSGSAFVQHEQAVLGELFDASDEIGGAWALGAFIALSPEQRSHYEHGLTLLMRHQVEQLFAATPDASRAQAATELQIAYRDWSRERFTCARRDRREYVSRPVHSEYGSPELTAPLWSGRLFLAGSETAREEGGYLEGALASAERVVAQIASD